MSPEAAIRSHEQPQEWDASPKPLRFLRLVREIGPRRTATRLASTLHDRYRNPLDRRLGTSTGDHVDETDIAAEVGGDHGSHSAAYAPLVSAAFARMLRRVLPTPSGTFVDIGSGRGRCVLAALEHGFDRSVGIEHSPTLARAAERNLERSGLVGGEIWTGDAAALALPPDTTLINLYNPFTPEVWQRVLDGPIAALGQPVRIVAHAMPHVSTVTSDRVGVFPLRTIWSLGRDFQLLHIIPQDAPIDLRDSQQSAAVSDCS